MPKLGPEKQAFTIFGSEIRTRIALAFVPDPELAVSTQEIARTIGRDIGSLSDPLNQLHRLGLLDRMRAATSKTTSYERTDHPLWAVYEAARMAMDEMGVIVYAIAENDNRS